MAVSARSGWRSVVFVVGGSLLLALLITRIPATGRVMNRDGYLAMATAVITLFPIARRILSGRFDIFEPIVWGCVMLLLLFSVRPLIMLADQNFIFQQVIPVQVGFGRAVLLGTIGSLAFVVSYEVWLKVRTPRPMPRSAGTRLDPARTRTTILWLVGIGVGLYLLRLGINGNPLTTLRTLAAGRSVSSGDTNSSAYLSDGPLLFAAAATIMAIRRPAPLPSRDRVLIATLMLGAVAAFYLLGNRRLILPSAATPVIAYCLYNRVRPKWRTIVIVLPVAFIILATIPFERSLGARQQTQGGAAGIFEQAFVQPFKPVGEFFTGPDTAMLPGLALEIQTLKTPSDYYYGRATIGDLLLSPIPSALVPGKPQTARNDLLTRMFGTGCVLRTAGAVCPDFSVIGTFYQDLWFVGVIIGMLALGVFSAVLWMRYRERAGSAAAIVLAASWTVSLPIIVRAGFMPPFQWWLEFVVPTLLAIHVARGQHLRRRRVRRRPRPVGRQARYQRPGVVAR
jgi:hypothetical protein